MTRQAAAIHVINAVQRPFSGSDAFLWQNPYGGLWNTVTNWLDTTTGTVAANAPTALNAVTVTGGTSDNFTDIVGTGVAAQLSINNDVLLWGSVAVAGSVTLGASADFDLDGASTLTAASLNLGSGALLVPGGASSVTVSGTAILTAGFLTVIDGSIVQLGALIANAFNGGLALETNTIAIDDTSSLEVGTAGGAALGAITIDAGQAAAVSGTLYGNVAVNGTLAVQAGGSLTIDPGDPYGSGQTIVGTGVLSVGENSLLTLGVADSAAIQFGAPAGILGLDILPSGTISGFAAGDFIELIGGSSVMATGINYTQTSNSVATLTLTKGGRAVGSLTLAGNYLGSLFHLGLDTHNDGFISLQTVGIVPAQPSLITGTAGSDTIVATANNQMLTGLGGNDMLNAATFTGIDFKDASANLNGDTITSFGTSDLIDLTDITPATASVSYVPGGQTATLIVSDGTRSATISLALTGALTPGLFTTGTDGAAGTDVQYSAANTDAYSFTALPGGAYGSAANWQDITAGSLAALAPGYGNAITMAGGATYTDITGNGVAASVAASGSVLLWGSLVAGSKLGGVTGALSQTGTLAMDGAAALTLLGTATVGGLLEIGGGSTLTAVALSFSSNGASLVATGGSSVQFPTLVPNAASPGGSQYDTSVIGVDPTSTIEIGTAGGATAGALTIDGGVTANLAGTINGNLVVKGTLAAAGSLVIAPLGSNAASVSGVGTVLLTYGDTVSLAGSDSAAILFSQTAPGSYAATTETLSLGTIMPTATISGFAKGDVITVGLIITNLTWNGTKLTLLNGGTTVGSLLLSGIYVASQFQVQLAPNGLSSIITYAATPSAAGGSSVSGNTDLYSWTNTTGGAWSNASNWSDTTAGGTAGAAPGSSNAVTITDAEAAWTSQIITGPGAAASLTIGSSANTILIGSIAVSGQFQVSQYGTTSGDVALVSGSNLTAGSLSVSSLLRLSGASLLTVLGSASSTFISGELAVGSGSVVRIYGGTNAITGTVAVDGTSDVEFGTAGSATGGTMAIDYGQALTLQGVANIAANVVVNGSLMAYSATIGGFGGSTGTITGTGTITIGALNGSGYLILNASDTVPIFFQPYSNNGVGYAFEDLELRSPFRTGIITGFIAGDSIIVDRNVTGASFKQTTNTQGTLTLTNGAAIVGTLTLNGNYATSLFQVDVAGQTGVATISLQTATVSSGTAPAGPAGHFYSWTGVTGGSWSSAANWQDTTTGTTTTTVPGAADVATIVGNPGPGEYTTVGGNGAAGDFTTTGDVLLTGLVNVAGLLHVSPGSSPAGILALEAGAMLTAGVGAQIFGTLEVGGGSSAVTGGTAALSGGSLLVLDGSTVQVGVLVGNGDANVIAVDSSSALNIGTSASTTGALTVGAGVYPALAGSIFGSVVDNSWLRVDGGGTLLIDMSGTVESDPYGNAPTIGGNGSLLLLEGSRLGLGVACSAAIAFSGPNATLELAAIPTGPIFNFAPGDQIQVDQTVTSMTYRQVTPSQAALTLADGAQTIGVLNVYGSFGGGVNAFHLDAAANGDTAVISLQSLQVAPMQQVWIQGGAGTDLLTATANGQILSTGGGSDTVSGGAFNGIDFYDFTVNFAGITVQDFTPFDMLDFIDMNPNKATETYAGGVLSVSDGTHAAVFNLAFANTPASGSFHVAGDGAAGTKLTWS